MCEKFVITMSSLIICRLFHVFYEKKFFLKLQIFTEFTFFMCFCDSQVYRCFFCTFHTSYNPSLLNVCSNEVKTKEILTVFQSNLT